MAKIGAFGLSESLADVRFGLRGLKGSGDQGLRLMG